MKASKLRNMPRGTFVELPWDGGVVNGTVQWALPLGQDESQMKVNINAGGVDLNIVMDMDEEFRVLGKITELTAVEVIQFHDDPDTVEQISEFLEADEKDVKSYVRFDGVSFLNCLDVSALWVGTIQEGTWLVKRHGEVVTLNSETFEVLFG